MSKVYVVANIAEWPVDFKIPDTIFDMVREGELISESNTKFMGRVSTVDFGNREMFVIAKVSSIFDNFRDAVEYAKQQLQRYSESLRIRVERIDCLLSEYKGGGNE